MLQEQVLQEQEQPNEMHANIEAESEQELQEQEQPDESSPRPSPTSLQSNAHTADSVSTPGGVALTNLGVTNHRATSPNMFFGEMDAIKNIDMLDCEQELQEQEQLGIMKDKTKAERKQALQEQELQEQVLQ